MVFQNGALFDSLTVAENILFSLELREDYDEKNKEEVVNGLLAMVDLQEDRGRFSRRSVDGLQASGRNRPRACGPTRMRPVRRTDHNGGPDHVGSPRQSDAAAEAATPPDIGRGDARSGPDA